MTISTRLDKAMRDAKIASQSELARRSGVPQPTINRILKGNGKRGPETATLVALAEATRVEVKWLQQGLGPQHAGGAAQQPAAPAGEPRPAAVEPEPPRFTLHWLRDDELELLEQYRSMTGDGQKLTRLFAGRQKRDKVGGAVDQS